MTPAINLILILLQQKFGIKTAGLDDKVTAMQMLVVYAKDLKDGFADYAEPVTKIMVPHLKFFFHELVRAAAAEILPYLLECVKVKGQIHYFHCACGDHMTSFHCVHVGPQAVQELWGYMADKLLDAINLEPDSDIVAIMMDSLCKVTCSPTCTTMSCDLVCHICIFDHPSVH